MTKKKIQRGGTRPGAGRPPSTARGNAEPLYIRVSAAERELVKAAHDAAGTHPGALTTFARDTLLRGSAVMLIAAGSAAERTLAEIAKTRRPTKAETRTAQRAYAAAAAAIDVMIHLTGGAQ